MQTEREIIVVTGLPRSGTSLCMRMLDAGGITTLTDGVRTADDDNPNGYYEFEAVKRTRDDPSWVGQATGNAVKMVYRLVYDLPTSYRYAVLFMRRDMGEVLQSQRTMLTRNHVKCPQEDDKFRQLFSEEIERFQLWLKEQPFLRVLEVDFNQLMREADPVISQVNRFLQRKLKADAMRQVVDPSLYRNRAAVARRA